MQLSDYELVRKTLDGDQNSFAELVSRYKKLIYSVVYHYIKNREGMDDICQEVFIKVYKALPTYNPQFKFSTWCVKITTNLCVDTIRRKRVNLVPMEEIESVSRESDTPEKRYISRERSVEIRKAITRLPEKYRTLIVLYHQKGMSYKEMAAMLNKPMSMIKNRLYRARFILRESLDGLDCGV